jgi:hypothetical protein
VLHGMVQYSNTSTIRTLKLRRSLHFFFGISKFSKGPLNLVKGAPGCTEVTQEYVLSAVSLRRATLGLQFVFLLAFLPP